MASPRTLLIAASTQSVTSAAGVTGSWGSAHQDIATEANRAIVYRTAGVLSNMTVQQSAAANVTWRSRKGNPTFADGNMNVNNTSTARTTDGTNTDSVTAGDKWGYQPSGSGATLWWTTAIWTANSGLVGIYTGRKSSSYSSVSATNPSGTVTANTSGANEVNARLRARVAGTLQNACLNVSSAAANPSSAVSRIAPGGGTAANGNISISMAGGATGDFEDTTHTDALNAGDDFYFLITPGASGPLIFGYAKAEISVTDPNPAQTDIFGGQGPQARTGSATTSFMHIAGCVQNTNITTENDQTAIVLPFNTTISNLRVNIGPNTSGASTTTTIRLRKNKTSNGNSVITITGTTTGIFEDLTHTDTFSAGDQAALSIVSSGTVSGAVTFNAVGATITDNDNVVVPSIGDMNSMALFALP